MNGDTPAPPQTSGGRPAPGQIGGQWQYKPNDRGDDVRSTESGRPTGVSASYSDDVQFDELEASWTASEFIDHSKGPGWYAVLGVGTLVLVVFLYLLAQDFVSISAVIIMAILVGIIAGRRPRVLEYHLDRAGLTIGQAFYPYSDFRSFSVIDEGALSSVMFSPLKRFMPPVSIYYDRRDEEHIVDVLSHYLPFDNQQHDAIDRFTRRIRF